MRITLLVTVLAIALGSCKKGQGGSGSPTGPSATAPTVDPSCPPSSSPPNCAPTNSLSFSLTVNASEGPAPAAFSVTAAGVTLSGTGLQNFRLIGLSPGVIEVSGQVTSGFLLFTIMSSPSNVFGGPVAGTIESVEGPGAAITRCTVRYLRPASVATPFRFRFTLTGSNQPEGDPTACRGGNF